MYTLITKAAMDYFQNITLSYKSNRKGIKLKSKCVYEHPYIYLFTYRVEYQIHLIPCQTFKQTPEYYQYVCIYFILKLKKNRHSASNVKQLTCIIPCQISKVWLGLVLGIVSWEYVVMYQTYIFSFQLIFLRNNPPSTTVHDHKNSCFSKFSK